MRDCCLSLKDYLLIESSFLRESPLLRIVSIVLVFSTCCANSFAQSKLDASAKAELEKCNLSITKEPTPLNYALRARFYREHGMFDEAIEDDDRALAIDGTNAFDWMKRGGDLCELGRYKDALPNLNKALSLAKYGDKVYINTLRARVYCYIHLGEKKKAHDDAQALVNLKAEPASSLNDADLH